MLGAGDPEKAKIETSPLQKAVSGMPDHRSWGVPPRSRGKELEIEECRCVGMPKEIYVCRKQSRRKAFCQSMVLRKAQEKREGGSSNRGGSLGQVWGGTLFEAVIRGLFTTNKTAVVASE